MRKLGLIFIIFVCILTLFTASVTLAEQEVTNKIDPTVSLGEVSIQNDIAETNESALFADTDLLLNGLCDNTKEAICPPTTIESADGIGDETESSVNSAIDSESTTGVEPNNEVEPSSGGEPNTVVEPSSGVELNTVVETSSGVELNTVVETSSGVELNTVVETSSGVELNTVVETSSGVEPNNEVEPFSGVEQNTVVEPTIADVPAPVQTIEVLQLDLNSDDTIDIFDLVRASKENTKVLKNIINEITQK
ncbi:hypothetical protein [Bacillus sp. Marseille-P3661]|uniref:hypothetical protein n=1 Tax=Bacillus sp. Marseille-P3661 TaxID=1936234 RepID=UPI000C843482|nr:hypothetical protein [Bacillus sp. Marseille-P3661]